MREKCDLILSKTDVCVKKGVDFNMGIIVDIILIAIIILNIFIGYKKGLIKVVFNIFAFFIAIVVSLILFKPVSNIIINNTEIDDKIREKILSVNNYDEESESIDDEKEEDKKTFIEKYIEDKVAEAGKEAKKKAVETAADVISIKATEIITGLILFISIRIALILLGFLTDTLSNIPIPYSGSFEYKQPPSLLLPIPYFLFLSV